MDEPCKPETVPAPVQFEHSRVLWAPDAVLPLSGAVAQIGEDDIRDRRLGVLDQHDPDRSSSEAPSCRSGTQKMIPAPFSRIG